jgi:hypothetical protein
MASRNCCKDQAAVGLEGAPFHILGTAERIGLGSTKDWLLQKGVTQAAHGVEPNRGALS